jgi:hypothetical protein
MKRTSSGSLIQAEEPASYAGSGAVATATDHASAQQVQLELAELQRSVKELENKAASAAAREQKLLTKLDEYTAKIDKLTSEVGTLHDYYIYSYNKECLRFNLDCPDYPGVRRDDFKVRWPRFNNGELPENPPATVSALFDLDKPALKSLCTRYNIRPEPDWSRDFVLSGLLSHLGILPCRATM